MAEIKRTLLAHFMESDLSSAGTIHAADFQRALDMTGLSFGDPIVDEVMVECTMDDEGDIDYSKFKRSVLRGRPSSVRGQIDSREGREVRTKIVHPLSSAPALHAPETLYESPEPTTREYISMDFKREVEGGSNGQGGNSNVNPLTTNNAKYITSELNRIFQDYDRGNISLDRFRVLMSDLGVKETLDARRLFERSTHSSFRFKDLLRALLGVESSAFDGLSAGAATIPTPQAEGEDFIYGKPSLGVRPLSSHRAKEINSTGDLITWRDQGGSGKRDAKLFASKGKRLDHVGGEGVSSLMKKMSLVDGPVPIVTANSAYGESDSSTPSAMVDSDGGATRKQVYALIRDLDQNRITEQAFVAQIQNLGLEIPRESIRLLEAHRYHGNADFRAFVKSFDVVLEKLKVPVEYTGSEDPGSPSEERRGRRVNKDSEVNARGTHGDIIGWKPSDGIIDEPDRDELFSARRHNIANTSHIGTGNILHWDDGTALEVKKPARRMDSFKTSGDFMSWETSETPTRSRRDPSSRTATPSATEQSSPYLYQRTYEEFSTKEKHKTIARKGQPKSGSWFDQVEVQPVKYTKRMAPFGTSDLDS